MLKEKTQKDLDRLKQGMSKSQQKMGVVEELLTFWRLEDTDQTLEELEEALIMSDFGPRTSLKIVDMIRPDIMGGKLKSGAEIKAALKRAIVDLLQTRGGSSELQLTGDRPPVILIVGVNGGGKTTTIGKLAAKFRKVNPLIYRPTQPLDLPFPFSCIIVNLSVYHRLSLPYKAKSLTLEWHCTTHIYMCQ